MHKNNQVTLYKMARSLGIVAVLIVASGIANGKDGDAPRVTTSAGSVAGVNESGILVFRGVPFAAPPVGNLRWVAPQPVKKWRGTRDTTTFGPRCMQLPVFGDMNFRSDSQSEDCLYLNIWTPDSAKNAQLPVLVYFYGGGFVAGDGSEPRYDGYSMAQRGIVAVTVNYRLGVFGFFAHPELSREASYGASGNYGLLDQNAALKWVRDNIAAFGGDPDKVTIAGESAGSISVSGQVVSPLSNNLFRGAIGESGSFLAGLRAVPLAEGEQNGKEFSEHVGASDLAALRALAAETLLARTKKKEDGPLFGNLFSFAAVVDGYFFADTAQATYDNNQVAQVPLLVGWNSEEMSHQMLFAGKAVTRESLADKLRELFGDRADQAMKVYHAETDEELLQVATDLSGDRFLGYSTWKWADEHAKTGNPVYRYYYSRPRPDMRPEFAGARAELAGGISRDADSTTPPTPKPLGAVHSAEIEYALGNLPTNRIYDWQPEDYRVSSVMQGFFANFIKTGNPNGLGLPKWPKLRNKGTSTIMVIDEETRPEEEPHRDRYLFLDSL